MGSLVRFYPIRVVLAFGLCVSLADCVPKTPRVVIPSTDTSPPTLIWQITNVHTKERREITQDGQTIDVPSNEIDVVTLAAEDLNSGVKELALSGSVHFKCEQGGQVEEKKYELDKQHQTAAPDYENKVPIAASLVYSVELNKHGCRDNQTFGGGTISLVGKAHNFVNGTQTKTLKVNLKK